MSTPILDPSLPADNAPIVAGELRGQFQAIEDSFADLRGRLMSPQTCGLRPIADESKRPFYPGTAGLVLGQR